VLFLFVVMMLDINVDVLRQGFWKHFPLALILGGLVSAELIAVLWVGFPTLTVDATAATVAMHAPDHSNTRELGKLLYSQYTYPVEVAAVILLLAMVAAIALTLRQRKESKAIDPAIQVRVKAEDRLVVAHSFSKSFLMTGWRLGWLVMPPSMTHHMGKLVEFNTSCASVFTQRAGIAALQHSDEITPRVVAHLQQCRDTLVPLLQALPGVEVASARGGMYAFFRLPGHDDSLTTAKRLVAEAGLGLAPGNAFGDEAQGWLRWCFASKDPQRLVQGVGRLKNWLGL
jgi:bifunctional pyridoxal-dependent enzyme with beta-cystathionase and maltose regulon repressor activities